LSVSVRGKTGDGRLERERLVGAGGRFVQVGKGGEAGSRFKVDVARIGESRKGERNLPRRAGQSGLPFAESVLGDGGPLRRRRGRAASRKRSSSTLASRHLDIVVLDRQLELGVINPERAPRYGGVEHARAGFVAIRGAARSEYVWGVAVDGEGAPTVEK
jgi:hypothetical protein